SKQAWGERRRVASVDDQREPAQRAAVEEIIREDPEARAIVAVLRGSAAAVKTAYDRPLHEPVPPRLLAAAGGGEPAGESKVVSLPGRKRWPDRPWAMALAASPGALASGLGRGQWPGRAARGG